jgi:quinol monooxygenase YgiN
VLIVLGNATAAPGRRDELIAAARAVTLATQGDRGCLAYSFSVDLEDENRILSVEIWADQEALDDHMGHDHTRDFLRAAPALVAGDPVMAFYEVPSGSTA